jgi:hypothetical protein
MTAESFWTMSRNKATKIGGHEKIRREDIYAIIQQEFRLNDMESTMSAAQLSEYGANNLLLPPLADTQYRKFHLTFGKKIFPTPGDPVDHLC